MPGVGMGQFQYIQNVRQGPQVPQSVTYTGPSAGQTFGQGPIITSNLPIYQATGSSGQVSVVLPDSVMGSQSFSTQPSPIAGTPFNASISSQPPTSSHGLVDVMHQTSSENASNVLSTTFNHSAFDPNDFSSYNFDPASFNFGNHYGALEFGMLGHMSSGAMGTPSSDGASLLNQSGGASYPTPMTMSGSYNESPISTQPILFPKDPGMGEWQPSPPSNSQETETQGSFSNVQDPSNSHMKSGFPSAFTIGSGLSMKASSDHLNQPPSAMTGFDEMPITATRYSTNTANDSRPSTRGRSSQQHQGHTLPLTSSTHNSSRRPRDPSIIYNNVTQPYSYTAGFHSLTAFIQRRFSPPKTVRIAKALASIRPSFISCTKSLTRDDLIFMEKCFQRTLWEYEEFISACSTPTIVIRRTGEVAAVGKEFTILTGWKKDVLFGKEPNLNINTGSASRQPGSEASSRGGLTPRVPDSARSEMLDLSRPQPVFIAELLDDDSVIDFYEDFSRLAFGDSRGSISRSSKLLKYRTKDDSNFIVEGTGATADDQEQPERAIPLHRKEEIAGEAGIGELGDKDGKVECVCCWTVKRDLFDIPMSKLQSVDLNGERQTFTNRA